MAVLERIRSKGPLVVVVICVAIGAFVLGDFLNSGSSIFQSQRETIANIGGEKLHYTDFFAAVEQYAEVYKIEMGQAELNEDVMSQIRANVWETLVNEQILNAEAEKTGLAVGNDELADRLYGRNNPNNIHPLILQRRAFADETGRFNRTQLLNFLNSLNQSIENEEQQAQLAQAKLYWNYWEKAVKNQILQEKYNALIAKAVVANTLEAQYAFNATKNTATVNYVLDSYFSIPDSTITVSQSEIKARYNQQKEQLFKQDESRDLKYVVFEVKPSPEDFTETEVEITKVAEEFKTANDGDVASVVNANSDVPYNAYNYTAQTIPTDLKDFAFSGKKGDVKDVFFHDNTYTMARIMETGIFKADSVKLRHIFLKKEDAAKEDSIVKAIRGGANFAELATKYSAATQTAANGGEIGWFIDNMQGVDKEMIDPAFAKSTNEIYTIKKDEGTQIFQIMEKTPTRAKVKVAILERRVTPSNRTTANIFNEAKQFAGEVKSVADFEAKAKEKNYMLRNGDGILKANDAINGIPQSRAIVRWAFENKLGTISDVFETDRTQNVVTVLTGENKDGYRSLESLTPQLKAEIVREKKGDLLAKKMSESLKQANGDLNALAAALQTQVQQAESVNFESYQFGTAGFEPSAIGKTSTLALNAVSVPVKGNSGVFVLQLVVEQPNEATFDALLEKQKLESRVAYSLPYMLMQELRKEIKITDNRLNFY